MNAQPDIGILFNRAVRLIAECAAVEIYECDRILVNISCNPAYEPLWAEFPEGIKAVILGAILKSGLARAGRIPRRAALLPYPKPIMNNPEEFTPDQIDAYRAYERVRAAGRFNMFDPRARMLTRLDPDRYLSRAAAKKSGRGL